MSRWLIGMFIGMILIASPLLAESYLDIRELVVDNERLVFRDNNLGIGVSQPTHSLVVSGNIKAHSIGTRYIDNATGFIVTGAGSLGTSSLLLGYETVYSTSEPGLLLTIVSVSDHRVVSTRNYRTDTDSSDATDLATALNAIDEDHFGFLTGTGEWERKVHRSLQKALQDQGLYKAGTVSRAIVGQPYAGVFRASTNPTTEGYESMMTVTVGLPGCSVAGFLVQGALTATGTQFNFLTSNDRTRASVVVNDLGYVGIGTYEPSANLHVSGNFYFDKDHTADMRIDLYPNIGSADNGGLRVFQASADALRVWFYPTNDWDAGGSSAERDKIFIGDTDGTTKKFRFDGDGSAHAASTFTDGGADFAEWIRHESPLFPGDVAGINLANGLVRKYQPGDHYIGICSTSPGLVGNNPPDVDNAQARAIYAQTYSIIGLKGQLEVESDQVVEKSGKFYTLDGVFVGSRLSDGRVYVD